MGHCRKLQQKPVRRKARDGAKQMSNKVYDIVTDRIIAALDAGVIPWRKEWTATASGKLPVNAHSGKPYRGINVLTLWCEQNEKGYASNQWVTYKQAQELGGNVRKGEKSTPVVFWKFDHKTDKETGETESFAWARYYSVFNVAQCDGLKTDAPAIPADGPVFTPLESAELVASRYLESANAPRLRHGGAQAFYAVTLDYVQMPERETFHSPEAYYSTLFHELAHSTRHASRLDRRDDNESANVARAFGSEDYSKEELTAELAAAFLCAESEIANDATLANSAAYIQGWLKALKNDRAMLVTAAQRAQRASDYILARTGAVEAAAPVVETAAA
jgi:antirestriction protein ArdC